MMGIQVDLEILSSDSVGPTNDATRYGNQDVLTCIFQRPRNKGWNDQVIQ